MDIAEKLLTVAENEQKVAQLNNQLSECLGGGTVSENDVLDKVYEAGQQSEYDRFWDSFQSYGKLTNYQSVFGGAGWKDDNFKPKYVPNIKMASLMFRETGIKNIVGLDFSKANDLQYTFYASKVVYIDEISTISASRLYQTFDTCTKLKTIGKLILKADGTQTFTNPFGNCTSLENIEIEGVIGNNGFNVSKSKLLTHDSLMSIINHLKDLTGTSSTLTCTLGTTNLAKLTDEEKAIATDKGWTLA